MGDVLLTKEGFDSLQKFSKVHLNTKRGFSFRGASVREKSCQNVKITSVISRRIMPLRPLYTISLYMRVTHETTKAEISNFRVG